MSEVASTLAVRRLDVHNAADAARWDAFVLGCPHATFFHRAGWQVLIREVFHHDTYFLYAESGGSIRGVLPLGHVKSRLFGNALTSLPFSVYGGVAALDEDAAVALEHRPSCWRSAWVWTTWSCAMCSAATPTGHCKTSM